MFALLGSSDPNEEEGVCWILVCGLRSEEDAMDEDDDEGSGLGEGERVFGEGERRCD